MTLFKPNCKVCQLSRRDAPFRARLYHATFKREEGDETLNAIIEEYMGRLSAPSVYNHTKRHMVVRSIRTDLNKQVRVIKKTAEIKATALKELEVSIDPDMVSDIEARPEQIIALDEYIAQGAAVIKEGALKITAQSFLAAVKIKNEWQMKQTGNKIELIKTIQAFRSGGKKQTKESDDRTASETTEGLDPGEEQTRDLYYAITRNAATSGAGEIST